MNAGTVVFFALGLVALVVGAEYLVRGASRLAVRTGLSSLVVGLTVVAFGTSAPELAVSVGASFRDQADIAIGNVVGSNIANVLLVLGISACFGGGLIVASRVIRIDVPIVIGASVLVLVFGLDGKLGRPQGLVLVAILIVYVAWTVITTYRNRSRYVEAEFDEALEETVKPSTLPLEIFFVVIGLAMLVVGAQLLVSSATDIAESLGVSEVVIGLTVVAIGTSLPEVATSVMAAIRGERDMAVGNAIGSNLFNLLAVLGVTALVSPDALPIDDGTVRLDLPVMIAVAVACLPIFFTGYLLSRWEGILFLLFYAAYITWLVLDAADGPFRRAYAVGMLAFVIPLTAITVLTLGYRELRVLSARHHVDGSQRGTDDASAVVEPRGDDLGVDGEVR